MEKLKTFLNSSYTPYQTCENSKNILAEHGFKQVEFGRLGKLEVGGKYFLSDGGTFAAFTVGKGDGVMIAAAHTDSPMLKIKGRNTLSGNPARLDCEVYGGAINYSFMDIPLKICGRVCTCESDTVTAHNVVSSFRVTAPSLAIHVQRDVNSSFSPSVQTDLTPFLGSQSDLLASLGFGKNAADFDLYACPAAEPYDSGANSEYLCSPRIDNLTSVFCALQAVCAAKPKGINICICFNSEETGSRTRTAAGSAYCTNLIKEIYAAAGKGNFEKATDKTLLLSVDNAHAVHPAHPEKSDPVTKAELGGGITVKHHVNYATDALSSSAVKKIFADSGVKVQDFYSNSDLPCGSTIGLIAAQSLNVRACDIGIAQLAMHSASEMCSYRDIEAMTKGLTAFFGKRITFTDTSAKTE